MKRISSAVRLTLPLAGIMVAVVSVGCAGPRGATQQALARARANEAEGAKVYVDNCQICHGDIGQGGPGAPAIMGGSALPVRLRAKRSAVSRIQNQDPNSPERKAYEESLVPGSGEREQRMRFRNAKDIFTFLTEKHPPMSASLEPEQYWAVLTFVLDAHGTKIPPGGLNEKNAESVANSN